MLKTLHQKLPKNREREINLYSLLGLFICLLSLAISYYNPMALIVFFLIGFWSGSFCYQYHQHIHQFVWIMWIAFLIACLFFVFFII